MASMRRRSGSGRLSAPAFVRKRDIERSQQRRGQCSPLAAAFDIGGDRPRRLVAQPVAGAGVAQQPACRVDHGVDLAIAEAHRAGAGAAHDAVAVGGGGDGRQHRLQVAGEEQRTGKAQPGEARFELRLCNVDPGTRHGDEGELDPRRLQAGIFDRRLRGGDDRGGSEVRRVRAGIAAAVAALSQAVSGVIDERGTRGGAAYVDGEQGCFHSLPDRLQRAAVVGKNCFQRWVASYDSDFQGIGCSIDDRPGKDVQNPGPHRDLPVSDAADDGQDRCAASGRSEGAADALHHRASRARRNLTGQCHPLLPHARLRRLLAVARRHCRGCWPRRGQGRLDRRYRPLLRPR